MVGIAEDQGRFVNRGSDPLRIERKGYESI